jgi:hypothetical protein
MTLYPQVTGNTFAFTFRSELATVLTVLFEGGGHPA